MRKFIKEYFSFTRSESRVILILSALIIISLVIRLLMPTPGFKKLQLTEEDHAIIDSFIQSLEKIEYLNENSKQREEKAQIVFMPKKFDPNTVLPEELEEMGFPDFFVRNLTRYRKAGGVFRQKRDIGKLYGVTDSMYISWEEYFELPVVVEKDTIELVWPKKVIIELNSADSASLLGISGIGPYYAGKIIAYRDRLGGFLKQDQLLEIRGMDEERLLLIESQIGIDSSLIHCMDLNTMDLQSLKSHPYITPRLAESIIKYREFAGRIEGVEELIENHIVTQAEFEKIQAYIRVLE